MVSSFTHGLLFSPLWSGRRREKASVWLPFSRKRINRRWDLASWPKSFTASLLHAHEGWPAYTKVTVSILLPALAAKVCRWIWPCSPDPRSSELSWEMPLVVVELKLLRFQKKLVYWSMVGFIGKHSYLFQEQGNRWFENMGGSHWKSLIYPVSQDYPIHSECWRSYLPDFQKLQILHHEKRWSIRDQRWEPSRRVHRCQWISRSRFFGRSWIFLGRNRYVSKPPVFPQKKASAPLVSCESHLNQWNWDIPDLHEDQSYLLVSRQNRSKKQCRRKLYRRFHRWDEKAFWWWIRPCARN